MTQVVAGEVYRLKRDGEKIVGCSQSLHHFECGILLVESGDCGLEESEKVPVTDEAARKVVRFERVFGTECRGGYDQKHKHYNRAREGHGVNVVVRTVNVDKSGDELWSLVERMLECAACLQRATRI